MVERGLDLLRCDAIRRRRRAIDRHVELRVCDQHIAVDVEEAALLDNTPRWKIFLRVLLPLTIPAQATLGIFTFLTAWNDYLWPLIWASRPDMYTLTLGLAATQTNFAQAGGIGFLMSQAVFAGLPIFIVYLFFQKHIVSAVAGTASR